MLKAQQQHFGNKYGEDLGLHKCNQTDFTLYYPDNPEEDLKVLTGPNTYCFDNPTQIVFDGPNAIDQRYLQIKAFPCLGETCLPEEEVKSLLNKITIWMRIITNVKSFYPEDYSEETMIKMKLQTNHYLVVEQQTNFFEFLLKEFSLESTQSRMGNFLPSIEKSWFNIDFDDVVVQQGQKKTFSPHIQLRVSLSPERKIYERSVYTTLDWLGDVGGLSDAL